MTENKQNNQNDILKWIIIGIAGFAVVVLIFGAGMFVGGMKARFSYRWAESYHKNFAGPRGGFFGDWRRPLPLPVAGDFIEGHGTFGEIIEVNPSTDSTSTSAMSSVPNGSPQASSGQVGFVIKGQGDIEKVILVAKDTVIKKGRETVKNGLEVGNRVVVIGSPNESGQIEAKLIRVFNGEDLKGLPKPPRFPF